MAGSGKGENKTETCRGTRLERPALNGLGAQGTSSFSLAKEASKGLRATGNFNRAQAMQLHLDPLADFLHSTQTLRHDRQGKRKAFYGEKIPELLALQLKGYQVSGKAHALRRWPEKPAYGPDARIFRGLLGTSGSIGRVMEALDRVAYGARA